MCPVRLVDKATGAELKVGDKVVDFRGDEHVLHGIHPPGTPDGGRGNGKIRLGYGVGLGGFVYPSVINATFVD